MAVEASTSPSISLLYERYFPQDREVQADWKNFKNADEEFFVPLSDRKVEFSINEKTWTDKFAAGAKTVLGALTIVPPVLHLVQRIVMIPLYPAQSRIARSLGPFMDVKDLNFLRRQMAQSPDLICRDVVLEKDGVRYSGMLMGRPDTIRNNNWILQAVGNGETIEGSMEYLATFYGEKGFNTLMINGPGVGKSEGQANPDSMGDAQELGISYMETALKAKNIVIAGRSLGGAAVGQAILKHKFRRDVNYLVVRQMTFDKVSNISSKVASRVSPGSEAIVASTIRASGCEMDNVAASIKLQEEGIPEVIVQASRRSVPLGEQPRPEDFDTDGVIDAEVSLGYALVQKNITGNKTFYCLPGAGHMTDMAFTILGPELEALSGKNNSVTVTEPELEALASKGDPATVVEPELEALLSKSDPATVFKQESDALLIKSNSI